MRALLSLCLLLTASANAQIYADFTVSSGGNSLGTFTVTLDHVKAPRTCANFIGLASGKRPWIDVTNGAVRTNTPYYDGLTFHRLIHSFVIQGGSPNGQGTDGPGYTILDEYDSTLRHSSDYVLSMAKSGFPNTGGSQFFITLRATPELDDKHSVFGTVTSGTSIIDGFKNTTANPTDRTTNTDPNANPNSFNNKPFTPIIMDSVLIYGPDYTDFNLNDISHLLPEINTTIFTPTRNAATGDFKIVFPRRAKTDYLFSQSTDLSTWTSARTLISFNSAPSIDYNFGVVSSPKFFVNGATVHYDLIPDSDPGLVTGEKTIRITYPDGSRLELGLAVSQGTWNHLNLGGISVDSGSLSNIVWTDVSPLTGFFNPDSSQAFRLPLGELELNFDKPAGPEELTFLDIWLSFHSENSGWLEEISGSLPRRLPFEILSN